MWLYIYIIFYILLKSLKESLGMGVRVVDFCKKVELEKRKRVGEIDKKAAPISLKSALIFGKRSILKNT